MSQGGVRWRVGIRLTSDATRATPGPEGKDIIPVPKKGAVQALLQHVQSCLDEGEGFLAFSGVSWGDFEEFYVELHKRHGRAVRLTYFGDTSQILFVKMPTRPHETSLETMVYRLRRQLDDMDLSDDFSFIGATKFQSSNKGGAVKEGDNGIVPLGVRESNRFPSLAIEVAYSEKLKEARQDKDWWFDNSPPGNDRGDVKAVLLLDIVQGDKLDTINMELWHRGKSRPSRKSMIQLKEALASDIAKIVKDQSLWSWKGLPMRIAFEDVALRPKQNSGEQDLLLTIDLLVQLATDIQNGKEVRCFSFLTFFPCYSNQYDRE